MTNLFDPEDEYYNLLSWHADQRQRLVQENMSNLGKIMARHRAELYEARIANKRLTSLVKEHVQEESKQILQNKRALDHLMKAQADELIDFVRFVEQVYPKFDGFDEILLASPLPDY